MQNFSHSKKRNALQYRKVFFSTVADPGFANGGRDHGERKEHEPKQGYGGGAPRRPLVPGGGQGANHLPHETESFLSIQNSGQKLRI